MARLHRQHVRLCARGQLQAKIARLDIHGVADHRAERRLSELAGRHVQQDVMHHGIPDQHDIGDGIGRDACLIAA